MGNESSLLLTGISEQIWHVLIDYFLLTIRIKKCDFFRDNFRQVSNFMLWFHAENSTKNISPIYFKTTGKKTTTHVE